MLNYLRFTRNRERLQQNLSLESDERLEGLVKPLSDCQLTLEGQLNERNLPVLTGTVAVEIECQCQVCTEAVAREHHFNFVLYPMTKEKIETLDEDLDPIVCQDEQVDVQEMVVNELILSLPTVLSHQSLTGEDCSKHQTMTAGEVVEKQSPFDVLKALKSKG